MPPSCGWRATDPRARSNGAGTPSRTGCGGWACSSDEEVAARLAGADVLCAPSLHGESFGMVLLEGMAAGCAVVASDIEGYRSAAGGHAVLVPPGDVPALTRALGTALAGAVEGSGQSATEQRKAAVEYARRWSMEALAERYVDVYTRAIAAYGIRRRPSSSS